MARTFNNRPRLERLLAHGGLRVTQQRLTVLDAMLGVRDDVTAQTLHEQLRKDNPKLGLATVYRTLSSLAEANVIDQLHHAPGTICYRYCEPGHHHHLICRHCHAVTEIRQCDLDDLADEVGAKHGFTDIDHSFELRGTCQSCLKSNANQ